MSLILAALVLAQGTEIDWLTSAARNGGPFVGAAILLLFILMMGWTKVVKPATDSFITISANLSNCASAQALTADKQAQATVGLNALQENSNKTAERLETMLTKVIDVAVKG